MKTNLLIAIKFTLVITLLCGVFYPLGITGLSQLLFPERANGQLISKNGKVVGSRLIGQSFTAAEYFHSRPSSAGAGYDASQSSGSNLAPTNQHLIERVRADVERLHAENPTQPIPVDLVTTSGSGLDSEISTAAAEFQVPRVARERQMSETSVRTVIAQHTLPRQFGFLGEARVRVLELNLALDALQPKH